MFLEHYFHNRADINVMHYYLFLACLLYGTTIKQEKSTWMSIYSECLPKLAFE